MIKTLSHRKRPHENANRHGNHGKVTEECRVRAPKSERRSDGSEQKGRQSHFGLVFRCFSAFSKRAPTCKTRYDTPNGTDKSVATLEVLMQAQRNIAVRAPPKSRRISRAQGVKAWRNGHAAASGSIVIFGSAPMRNVMRAVLGVALLFGCTAVDPGPQFVIAPESFNEDFFFCYVEPQYIYGKKCGSGDTGDGGRCHFNSSAVSGMALRDHPPIACDGAGHPVDRSTVSTGSLARANFSAASLEFSRDYLTAPILVRPLGATHPRPIFMKGDPVIDVLQQWAAKP